MMPSHAKVAIVTGSSRGIGAATALALANKGVDVVVHYTSDSSSLQAEQVACSVKNLGRKAAIVKGNIALEETAHTLVEAAQGLAQDRRTIDIVVNNAAITANAAFGNVTEETFTKVMAVNVWGGIRLLQACKPHLPQGGHVVFVGSMAGTVGMPLETAYASSKGALRALVPTIRNEWADEAGVTVSLLEPGPVDTDMWNKDVDLTTVEMVRRAGYPTASPQDVADSVVLLASDKAEYLSASPMVLNDGIASCS